MEIIFKTSDKVFDDEYPNIVHAAVDVMCQIKNAKKNIVRKNKYENHNHNSNQENENRRNESIFAQTSKIRCFCCGSKDHMLDTCPMKDDVEKISGSRVPIKISHTYRRLVMRTILVMMMCQ